MVSTIPQGNQTRPKRRVGVAIRDGSVVALYGCDVHDWRIPKKAQKELLF
ncbi:MAG: hypothetical protein ACK5IJ_10145 [Mangrovibacterium sp.]